MKGRQRHGFTLVELLIVIVIIAILATIGIVTYGNISRRAYESRASSELSAIARAVALYKSDKDTYPADVSRNIPVSIFDYSGGQVNANWPNGPWPGSTYDYDYFLDSGGKEVVQISIRFCPLGGQLSDCRFPNEPWTAGFGIDSSAYWCITGACRSHPNQPDDYPGYCLNCPKP